jgi:hypothetical protein
MMSSTVNLDELISGPLLSKAGGLPLSFRAVLGDLRARMIVKGRIGCGYRAVTRNGRILLASDRSLEELVGQVTRVRIQTWNRIILSGEAPEFYGLLLHVRAEPPRPKNPFGDRELFSHPREESLYALRLLARDGRDYDLTLDVGGGMVLAISRCPN